MFSLLLLVTFSFCTATDFYVSIHGDDLNGDGSAKSPWKSISYALKKIAPNQGHTLRIAEGIYFESAPLQIPVGTNFTGAGINKTVLKSAKSFYYNPKDPGPEPNRFLVRLESEDSTPGRQYLSDFTIEGSGKQLHGGIYVHNRSNVVVRDILVQNTNFAGIWLLSSNHAVVRSVTLQNCAWGSTDWCSGALMLAHSDNVDLDHLNINEGTGYGIKTFGHDVDHVIKNFRLHDSRISVNPEGLWQNGKAPNISVELWANEFVNSEIDNNYFDNHLSIVNNREDVPATGQMFRIHHNFIDLRSRAKGAGYGIELTIHDAEIDHNIFYGGFAGICNWAKGKENWKIHHNVFYAFEHVYPTAVIYAQQGYLKDVLIYNNTVETMGNSTVNFLQCNNGGKSENITIQNNLIINSNDDYLHYPNRLISLEQGATIQGLVVENNLLFNLPIGDVEGEYKNNRATDPKIRKIGIRPFPYYLPDKESPLIDAGKKLQDSFGGQAPDIGAYESH